VRGGLPGGPISRATASTAPNTTPPPGALGATQISTTSAAAIASAVATVGKSMVCDRVGDQFID